jgi:ABC-2 type transport system ATP-binding protein
VRRRAALALALAPLLALPLLSPAPAAAQAAAAVEVVPLVFTIPAGPDDTPCTVVGDLYVPRTATSAAPAAAILATNGFGGSKNDGGERGNATVARHYAERGYVGLSYSGLGFGGSGCEITLDQRVWDGKVGDALAQFLGGRKGLATRDGQPYDVGGIVRTERGLPFDPVLGMIGVSYGGEVQFATASFGRVDTIVPQITWNDLSYSLAPSNTGQLRTPTDPRSVSAPVGVSKIGWTSLFFALGLGQDVTNRRPADLLSQVTRANACPNFDSRACTAILDLASDGAPSQATIDFAREASVASYLDEIDIPVLLSQGQADTLFNLQEAIATWSALKQRDVPVKMVWQSWGHSTATPVPGELDQRRKAEETFLGAMYAAWFDHHLLGKGPKPSLDTEYFRDWAYSGDTRAAVAAAYARAPGYPVAPTQRLLLSGGDALVADPAAVEDGTAQFANLVPAGAPQSYSEYPVVAQDEPPFDAPGTFAQFTTEPLAKDLDLAGVPALTVQLSRTVPAVPLPDGAGGLVLFAKLYDIAPDGAIKLQHKLVSAVRLTDLGTPVRIELPGVVQRFPAGHRLAVVLAASDTGYRGNVLPSDVTVTTSKAAPGVLELPVLPAAAPPPARPAPGRPAAAPAPAPATGQLPATGASALLPLLAALLVTAGLVTRRRRTNQAASR